MRPGFLWFLLCGDSTDVRLLRLLRNGIRTAQITVVDEEYIRIDIRGVVATGHVYLYFLHGRFWENHPFSAASSVIEQSDVDAKKESIYLGPEIDMEKSPPKSSGAVVRSVGRRSVEPGTVLYLRILDGATSTLRLKSRVKVLIEGSYGTHQDFSEYPTLICIAGGVGVTSCLPYLRAHPGNAFLYWGSRSQALVDSFKPLTNDFNTEIVVGQRLNLSTILEEQRGDFAVVVSGPADMMDETRSIVSKLARARSIKFVPESFSF